MSLINNIKSTALAVAVITSTASCAGRDAINKSAVPPDQVRGALIHNAYIKQAAALTPLIANSGEPLQQATLQGLKTLLCVERDPTGCRIENHNLTEYLNELPLQDRDDNLLVLNTVLSALYGDESATGLDAETSRQAINTCSKDGKYQGKELVKSFYRAKAKACYYHFKGENKEAARQISRASKRLMDVCHSQGNNCELSSPPRKKAGENYYWTMLKAALKNQVSVDLNLIKSQALNSYASKTKISEG